MEELVCMKSKAIFKITKINNEHIGVYFKTNEKKSYLYKTEITYWSELRKFFLLNNGEGINRKIKKDINVKIWKIKENEWK
ncbi:MAG: hypothetical protein KFW07_03365 [Mycoplasmataceae bacterium]|nr:hypothetical protein [Mycoplasmataceae bacterium]